MATTMTPTPDYRFGTEQSHYPLAGMSSDTSFIYTNATSTAPSIASELSSEDMGDLSRSHSPGLQVAMAPRHPKNYMTNGMLKIRVRGTLISFVRFVILDITLR